MISMISMMMTDRLRRHQQLHQPCTSTSDDPRKPCGCRKSADDGFLRVQHVHEHSTFRHRLCGDASLLRVRTR